MLRVLALLGLLLPLTVWAAANTAEPSTQNLSVDTATAEATTTVAPAAVVEHKLQANIVLHTLAELEQLLVQAEVIASDKTQFNLKQPIAVVLYGEEIRAFIRSNYRTNKELVDLAARLDAYSVIELKVCQHWMGENTIKADELPSFLEPVPVGAEEKSRLQQAGYAYF